jgi:membrane protease YdiL (CAAX protease family)
LASPTPPGPRADRRALGSLVAALAAANVVRSTWLDDGAHLPFNVAVGAGALAIGRAARLDRDELGVGDGALRRGLRWGLPVLAVIGGAAVLGGLLPATSSLFEDPRGDIGAGELLLRTLVVIPVGTVLVEEVAFRGVLQGLAGRLLTPVRAGALTAVLFGWWHVLPAWNSAEPGEQAAAALGTLVATTAAGAGFSWLRHRSGSLLAPVLAHIATNSAALVGAWLAMR